MCIYYTGWLIITLSILYESVVEYSRRWEGEQTLRKSKTSGKKS